MPPTWRASYRPAEETVATTVTMTIPGWDCRLIRSLTHAFQSWGGQRPMWFSRAPQLGTSQGVTATTSVCGPSNGTRCHDPSHGGSYVVEGRLLIRIGLCPRRCPRGLASRLPGCLVCYLVCSHWLCVVSYVPPSRRCLCTILSDSAVIWGCICTYYRLVIMRVGVRLHGTLYPMTDCVLYLGRTIVWVV